MFQSGLAAKRILVVEDDYLQARAICDTLIQHRAEVVGPFPTVEKCMDLRDWDSIDAAVIDVMVGNGTSFRVADRLQREGIPFLFLSGYDGTSFPARFRSVPHYLKPYVGQDVPTALALAIACGRRPAALALRRTPQSCLKATSLQSKGDATYGRRES